MERLRSAAGLLLRPVIRVFDAIGDVIVFSVAIKAIQWTTGWNVVAWLLS